MAKFNFDSFLSNFGKVASNTVSTYEAKQAEGKSLHQADYVNLGVGVLFAALAAIEASSDTPKTE